MVNIDKGVDEMRFGRRATAYSVNGFAEFGGDRIQWNKWGDGVLTAKERDSLSFTIFERFDKNIIVSSVSLSNASAINHSRIYWIVFYSQWLGDSQ